MALTAMLSPPLLSSPPPFSSSFPLPPLLPPSCVGSEGRAGKGRVSATRCRERTLTALARGPPATFDAPNRRKCAVHGLAGPGPVMKEGRVRVRPTDCPALARGAPGDFGDGNPQSCARAMPRDTGKLIDDGGSEQKTHVALARTIAPITAGREDVGGALPADQAHPARLEALESGWDGYAVVLDVWLDLMNTGLARLESACSANLYGSGSCHAGMISSASATLLSRASLGLRRHSLALLLAVYRRDCPACTVCSLGLQGNPRLLLARSRALEHAPPHSHWCRRISPLVNKLLTSTSGSWHQRKNEEA
ncbi:uncharacterized protein SCHCODRAFT_01341108 [Schizophyllum commune H4-8]|nr:uncharacterized protein SCHCODRAFT_01341108 [Schizophyllum commune H4-8]KAI5886150.1 hypothetical protein SCHCODRAFT_01341108 [Schizophyllum commune H4-8]